MKKIVLAVMTFIGVGVASSMAHDAPYYAPGPPAPVQPAYGFDLRESRREIVEIRHEPSRDIAKDYKKLDQAIQRDHAAIHRRLSREKDHGVPDRQIQDEHAAAHRQLTDMRQNGRAEIRELHDAARLDYRR